MLMDTSLKIYAYHSFKQWKQAPPLLYCLIIIKNNQSQVMNPLNQVHALKICAGLNILNWQVAEFATQNMAF